MDEPLWLTVLGLIALVHLVLMRHALRAGSTRWAIAIMIAPFLGGAIYYIEEYRPAVRARKREEAGLPPEPQPLPFR
jgi:hypothetical protein